MTEANRAIEFKAAVIGSGVMGAAIAAHFANAGIEVTLLDIVPDEHKDGRRDKLAEDALSGLAKRSPAPLLHEKCARLITPGNLEDDLERVAAEADWIVEAIIERADIKRNLYKNIFAYLNEKAIVSSNTSTIPLSELTVDMEASARKRFGITHFFNPPRYMRLLELVKPEQADEDAFSRVEHVITEYLGKEIVPCHDTPGFIANRIGCYWIAAGVGEAKRYDVSVEEADAILSAPFGIPKTGVFGLCDLIGIDLIPLIARAFGDYLNPGDAFFDAYGEAKNVTDGMIEQGYTGRKGKGGFYRLHKTEDGKKEKQSRDMQSGEYRLSVKAHPAAARLSKEKGAGALFSHDDNIAKYAAAVMGQTLLYAAEHAGDIAESVYDIDRAMCCGYNWKYGPFALIDRIGPQILADFAEKHELDVPPALAEACKKGGFYKIEAGENRYLKDGDYTAIRYPADQITVARAGAARPAVLKNGSAALWDIGDGIACLEFRSKMNTVDPDVLEMFEKSAERAALDFNGLVIANDADNFCVGANLAVLLFAANTAGWKEVEDIIARGQNALMGFKYAPFPVVAAPTGMALGGGCELLLHCDAVQPHAELYAGLVEAGVGVVPGWGGCKEMLWRRIKPKAPAQDGETGQGAKKTGGIFGNIASAAGGMAGSFNTLPAIKDSFETIALAKVSKSAEEARDMHIIGDNDRITMNRAKLLFDAKQTCKELAAGYTPPQKGATVKLPGKTAQTALKMAVSGFIKKGVASEYDGFIAEKLAYVLTGGDTSLHKELTEDDILKLERDAFCELIREKKTLDRIEYMLENGKPLRN